MRSKKVWILSLAMLLVLVIAANGLGYDGAEHKITVWTNKEAYQLGESIEVKFRINREGWVNVFYLGKGEVRKLLPTDLRSDNHLRSGTYSLPAPNHAFKADFFGGSGRILALVSQRPLMIGPELDQKTFALVSRDPEQFVRWLRARAEKGSSCGWDMDWAKFRVTKPVGPNIEIRPLPQKKFRITINGAGCTDGCRFKVLLTTNPSSDFIDFPSVINRNQPVVSPSTFLLTGIVENETSFTVRASCQSRWVRFDLWLDIDGDGFRERTPGLVKVRGETPPANPFTICIRRKRGCCGYCYNYCDHDQRGAVDP